MPTPTRFPNGQTNVAPRGILRMLLQEDPTALLHSLFDDFDFYYGPATAGTSNGWVLTEVAVGLGNTNSVATLAVDGGALRLTTDNAASDSEALQIQRETFLFASGKKLWFKTRIRISQTTTSRFIVGLQDADTTPFDVTHGVYFKKDADTNIDFVVENGNTATDTDTGADVTADTWVTLAFYYDGKSTVEWSVDGTTGTSVTTNLPTDTGDELTLSLYVETTAAASITMDVDYVYVAKER